MEERTELARQSAPKIEGPSVEDDAVGPGDTITVTAGKQVFTPHKFHVFEVGPCSVTVVVRAGESYDAARRRASIAAQVALEAEFTLANRIYFERMGEVKEKP